MNFTKKTIEALPLPPKDKRSYFYDTKVQGLELMVTHQGAKSFKVYRKFNDAPIRISLGKYPQITVEEARRKAQQVIAELINGKNPNAEKKKVRAEITFGKMFETFMERYSKRNKKSWKYDEREVNKFLPHWFQRKLSSINKQEVQTLHEKMSVENGLYQANRLLERIKAIYNKAIEWGWEGTNPAKGVKKCKEKSRKRFLHPDELPSFFESLELEKNDTIKDYVYISLLTGARKTNVLEMRWKDVNFDRQEWLIPDTKNDEPLRVPLVLKAIEILKSRLQKYGEKEWVFQGSGKTGHMIEPKSGWKRILKQANIEDLRLHDLRRTVGSWQAATGANSYIIGGTLGHKDQKSTAVYARLNIDPIRASLEKATQAMLQATKK
ncbi:MAG: tyrosine-type recombinase/integrase [Alphaproteobacteria bacterium]